GLLLLGTLCERLRFLLGVGAQGVHTSPTERQQTHRQACPQGGSVRGLGGVTRENSAGRPSALRLLSYGRGRLLRDRRQWGAFRLSDGAGRPLRERRIGDRRSARQPRLQS